MGTKIFITFLQIFLKKQKLFGRSSKQGLIKVELLTQTKSKATGASGGKIHRKYGKIAKFNHPKVSIIDIEGMLVAHRPV